MLIEILPNILLLSVLLISFNLLAVPARPGSKIVTQADGSTLKVCLNGDEWYNWMTTEDGYRIVPNSEGIYEYAAYLKSGIIVPTGIKVNDLKSRTKEEYVFLGSVPKNIGISRITSYNVCYTKLLRFFSRVFLFLFYVFLGRT